MALLQPSLAATMCTAPCGWLHPPPHLLTSSPFLLTQNLHNHTETIFSCNAQCDVTKNALNGLNVEVVQTVTECKHTVLFTSNLDFPFQILSPKVQDKIWNGKPGFEGIHTLPYYGNHLKVRRICVVVWDLVLLVSVAMTSVYIFFHVGVSLPARDPPKDW